MSNLKLFLFALSLVLLSACSTKMQSTKSSAVEPVKVNAELALKECGQGNVKKVTSTGFECFVN